MYTLILADDHQFLLEGIQTILKEEIDFKIITTVQNGYQLIDAVRSKKPDLVLLDLNMPGMDGIKSLLQLKKDFPDIKVLILTNYNQPELIDKIRKMNADGFLIKNSSAHDLKEAIRIVLSGKSYYPHNTQIKATNPDSYFFDEFLKKFLLTKREVEIIRMVCMEMSSKEIATTLFLSELTVNTHRRNIIRKLEIKNLAGLINFAKEHQII